MRVKRNGRKERDAGLPESIRQVNGDVERRIVDGTLRTLHPVHNTGAIWIGRAFAAHRDPRIRG